MVDLTCKELEKLQQERRINILKIHGISKDGKIIGKGSNHVLANNDPTAHAEVLVISEYCKKTKKVYLKDYILISSTEPCVMCSGAIKWAKIGQIYYSVPQQELNRISGGKQKPSCESLINSGFSQKHIVGNILLDEGLKVYDDFKFTQQDERK